MSLDTRRLCCFKVVEFIGIVNFLWHSLIKIANIGMPVLQRVCEQLYCLHLYD